MKACLACVISCKRTLSSSEKASRSRRQLRFQDVVRRVDHLRCFYQKLTNLSQPLIALSLSYDPSSKPCPLGDIVAVLVFFILDPYISPSVSEVVSA